jgi:DNA-binding transcriptional MocR family regulator
MILDPWLPEVHHPRDRPFVLCEVFVYPAPLSQTVHKGVLPAPVEIDELGMVADGPGGLRDVLENWDPNRGQRPKFLYTVT